MTASNLTQKRNSKLVLFFYAIVKGRGVGVYEIKPVLFLFVFGLLAATKLDTKETRKNIIGILFGNIPCWFFSVHISFIREDPFINLYITKK